MSRRTSRSAPVVPVVSLSTLRAWSTTQAPQYLPVTAEPDKCKFPINDGINRRIYLWLGNIASLDVDAVVNSSNEALNERNPLSESLHQAAGPELRQECWKLDGCKTGEAKITPGFRLPARHVIHTVGPRFNPKYATAAESALFNCYRNSLQLLREQKLHTIAIPPIHTLRRGYPPEGGAHIALRTVRRFMERHGEGIDAVVFVAEPTDIHLYEQLMPLYFPRTSAEEAYATRHLPENIGNEDGEPVIEERKIRIADNPVIARIEGNDDDGEVSHERARALSTMSGDHDSERRQRLGSRSEDQGEIEALRRYQRRLKAARQEDVSDIAKHRMLYQSGTDSMGRPIIMFVGKYCPAASVDPERLTSYLISTMDPLVGRDFVVVYFHTQTESDNLPDFSYMRDLYELVDKRYKRNLRALYIVHPTFWSRCATWFFTTFTATNIKERIRNIDSLHELYAAINPDQLNIPPFVLDYDHQENGPSLPVSSSFRTPESATDSDL
eukprot:Opistho-1_new@106489